MATYESLGQLGGPMVVEQHVIWNENHTQVVGAVTVGVPTRNPAQAYLFGLWVDDAKDLKSFLKWLTAQPQYDRIACVYAWRKENVHEYRVLWRRKL